MAELFMRRATSTADFGCYSERGIMSYFMFVHLPDRVGQFLGSLKFPSESPNPFCGLSASSLKTTIFSELDFGNEGFGKPDGAIFVDGPEPMMLLIEVKLNETYEKSCQIADNSTYNSTIKGQLELKWRLSHLHETGQRHVKGYDHYIKETPALKAIYGKKDRFYSGGGPDDESNLRSWRRLKVIDGVGRFLSFMDKCRGRVYFCAITDDKANPFDCVDRNLMPRCGTQDWESSKRMFCWLPASVLKNAGIADDLST